MKRYLKIAWRNLWRNKRRTMITVGSVSFAIFMALIMRSMQYGSYNLMEREAIKNSTGYIQVHAEGYWNDKNIDNTFENSSDLFTTVEELENVSMVIPRLESFALASHKDMTKGIGIIGTKPKLENNITKIESKIIQGEYFQSPDDSGILLGDELADFLGLNVGDTITLISQGFRGNTAAGINVVRGIFHFPAPDMNKRLVYMTLSEAQYFYAAPSRATSYSIMLINPDKMDETFAMLEENLGSEYEIMTWDEMLVELKQQIQSDNIGGIFMLAVLYIVVAFGIFGTILMMTHERRREFSVMVATGMQRYKLAAIVFFETLYMGLIGVIAGSILSLPVVYVLHKNPIPLNGEMAKAMEEFNVQPILPFALEGSIYLNQAIVVFIVVVLISVYPLININRFNLISGLRS